MESKFESVTIAGTTRQPLRELAGFDKRFHSVPNSADRGAGLISQISEKDVSADLEAVFQKLKHNFKFKRIEIQAEHSEPNCGVIRTPFFVYSVDVRLDDTDFSVALWDRSVIQIDSTAKVLSHEFAVVFDFMFDRVEYSFRQPLQLEDWIDHVEAKDDRRLQLEYDSQLTECALKIENLSAKIEIDSDKVAIIHPQKDQAATILKSFLEARDAMSLDFSEAGIPGAN